MTSNKILKSSRTSVKKKIMIAEKMHLKIILIRSLPCNFNTYIDNII